MCPSHEHEVGSEAFRYGDIAASPDAAVMLVREGAPLDNAMIRESAWGYYHEVPGDHFLVGGAAAQRPTFKFKVTTPEGVLDDNARAGLVEDIAAIFDAVVGSTGAGFDHGVVLREIKDGGWGTGGKVTRLADIRASAFPRQAAAARVAQRARSSA